MEAIRHGERQFAYSIVRRNRRKTVGIAVKTASQVVVYAPLWVTEGEIGSIVRRKAPWIIRRLEKLSEFEAITNSREYVSGEQLLYLGRAYRLKVLYEQNRRQTNITVKGRRICITLGASSNGREEKAIIKTALKRWYIRQAEETINQRMTRLASQLGVLPTMVRIKDQKTRWGSCSSKGTVHFNWRIVMAPVSVLDYVIIHELCHLRVRNHSQEFWKLVSQNLLEYKSKRDWLKKNSPLLHSICNLF